MTAKFDPFKVLRRLLLNVVAAIVLSCGSVFAQGAMTNGANHSGAISSIGEQDLWTFAATTGDAISVSIGEVAPLGAFRPWIRLRAPNGTTVDTDWGETEAGVGATATQSGTYTVVIADFSGPATGSYLLTLAKTPGAFVVPSGDEGGPMTNGANHAGAIHLGDIDQWTFTATLGDAIFINIGEVAPLGNFRPWIGLRAPDGTTVDTDWGETEAGVGATATQSGTYTVLIADFSGPATGSYLLTLAKTPGAFVVPSGDEGGPMTNGANHAGAIHLGDIDQWTFTATLGDAIFINIGEVAPLGNFRPWIGLRAPDGTTVDTDWGETEAGVGATATQSGTYTVVIADFSGPATGSYLLTLAKTPGSFVVPSGDEGGPMTNGANHAGAIHLGDIDQWTFTATLGDAIFINIGEVAPLGNFRPWIGLRAPNGATVDTDWGETEAGVGATATQSGTYTVVIADFSGPATGSYLLTLAKTPGAFVVPPGDEGGPMTNGASHAGAIHLGDIDQWTFKATAGHVVSVSIGEVAPLGGFRPWIGLRAPNGTTMDTDWGETAAGVEVTATQTGTYTVVVADFSGPATGNYLLTVVGADANPPPFTDDPLVVGVTQMRPIHIAELRARINAVRATYKLAAFSYTEAISAGVIIKASHIAEMRTALAQAYSNAGRTLPVYSDPALAAGMLIKAVHIAELRQAAIAIE
jgi:hypothetical protein